jgi:hypothetical protein
VLDIPNFHMSSDHDANPSSRTPDPLSSDEKREIKDHVAALAHRPGVEHPHEIDVEIDGEFAGTLMLGGGIQETLTLRRGTSRIYLFERATRHLLAVHLIDYEGERITNAHAYADIGDAGRLKIIISPAADGSGNLRLQYSPPRHSWLFAWARSGPPRLQRRAILLITGCICAACVMLLAFNLISTNRLSERLSAAQSREKVLVRELAEAKASRNADEVISYSLAAVDSTLGSPKRGPDNHPPRFIVTSKTKAIELRAIVSSARETYTVSLLTLDADKPLLIEYGLKASQNDGSPLLRVILPANAFQGSVTYYLLEARSESNNGTSRRELFPFAIARQ